MGELVVLTDRAGRSLTVSRAVVEKIPTLQAQVERWSTPGQPIEVRYDLTILAAVVDYLEDKTDRLTIYQTVLQKAINQVNETLELLNIGLEPTLLLKDMPEGPVIRLLAGLPNQIKNPSFSLAEYGPAVPLSQILDFGGIPTLTEFCGLAKRGQLDQAELILDQLGPSYMKQIADYADMTPNLVLLLGRRGYPVDQMKIPPDVAVLDVLLDLGLVGSKLADQYFDIYYSNKIKLSLLIKLLDHPTVGKINFDRIAYHLGGYQIGLLKLTGFTAVLEFFHLEKENVFDHILRRVALSFRRTHPDHLLVAAAEALIAKGFSLGMTMNYPGALEYFFHYNTARFLPVLCQKAHQDGQTTYVRSLLRHPDKQVLVRDQHLSHLDQPE